MIMVTSSFSKSSVSKMFTVHTKMLTQPVFLKSPGLPNCSVEGTLKVAFIEDDDDSNFPYRDRSQNGRVV